MKTLRNVIEANKGKAVDVWFAGQQQALSGKVVEIHEDYFSLQVGAVEHLVHVSAVAHLVVSDKPKRSWLTGKPVGV